MPISTDIFGRLDWLTKRLKRLYAIVNSNTQAVTEVKFNNPCFLETVYDGNLGNYPSVDQVASLSTVPFSGYYIYASSDASTKREVHRFYGGGAYVINSKINQDSGSNLVSINDGCGIVTGFNSTGLLNSASLRYVNLPNITDIPSQTFLGCIRLASVFFPRVATVGSEAFALCESIENIDLPLVTNIQSNAFSATITSRTININLPKLVDISSDAFQNWASNTINLTIPAALENNGAIQYLITSNTVNLNLV